VFKIAAFRIDASVKTSSPLRYSAKCRVNHSLVKSHADMMHWLSSYKAMVDQWANRMWCYQNNKQ